MTPYHLWYRAVTLELQLVALRALLERVPALLGRAPEDAAVTSPAALERAVAVDDGEWLRAYV